MKKHLNAKNCIFNLQIFFNTIKNTYNNTFTFYIKNYVLSTTFTFIILHFTFKSPLPYSTCENSKFQISNSKKNIMRFASKLGFGTCYLEF